MANIKLKNNYWVTESIYDTTDSKTQKQVNAALHQDIEDTVIVSDTQPSATANQIWLPQTIGEGVQVPTWAEHQALSTGHQTLSAEVNEINDCLVGKTIVLLGDSNADLWGETNPFSDVENVTFYNLAVGGAVWSTQNQNNIEAQYNSMVSSGYTPDYVILWAGGNDISTYFPNWGLPMLGTYTEPTETTTFESMRRVLCKLRNNYPTAKLFGIVRGNKQNSNTPINRFTYVMGIIERIYEAWNVPVLSFDSISNITVEISNSRSTYFENDNIHYNSAGLKLFTNMIKNALRGGLVTHSARRIEVLFAPTTCATVDQAAAWVVDQLLKGNASYANWWIEQKGYRVVFVENPSAAQSSWTLGECMIFTFAPAVGFYTDGKGHAKLRDTVGIGGSNNHQIPWFVDQQGGVNIASMENIRDGFVNIRMNQLNANTAGVPSAIATDLANNPWQLQGGWQNNGYYKGLLYAANPVVNLPTIGSRIVFIYAEPSGTGHKWNFTTLDGAHTWNTTTS